jgi:7-keto-8-aminopelargonate synthetase-like enzyme
MFSGPLPSVLLAGAVAATEILLSPRLAELQARLWENQRRVVEAVRNTGWQPLSDETPIVCVDFTDTNMVEAIVTCLHEHQVLASVVAFPAVPRGHLRIRLSVSANHTADDIDCLSDALQAARNQSISQSRTPIQASY